MASTQSGKFRPWTLIWSYVVIVVVLYGLVFFTPGQNTMKLGIDLQGGTRVTLQAKTIDGSTPTRESMIQARTIMETRVNGSGVVGAQVQQDGASQLVVTVPGQKDLGSLVRAAKLNIRPVTAGPIPVGSGAPEPTSSGAPNSSASGSPSASSSATEEPAIGDTISETSTPAPSSPPASVGVGNDPNEESSAAGSASASESAVGVRGRVGAVTTPSASSADAGTTGRMTTQGAPSEGSAVSTTGASSAAPSTTGASGAAPSTTAGGSGSADPSASGGSSVSGSSAPGSSAAGGPQWPAGSDPKIPIQPSGTDEAAFTAWLTAAQTAVQTGTITCGDVLQYQGLDDQTKPVLACDPDNINLYVLDKTLIPGDQIASASAGVDGGAWVINVGFNSTGFNTWASYTTANVGKQTAFTLDGQVLSAPAIQEPITTPTTRVSGQFNQETATSLANSLKFGSLPLQFVLDKTDEVSAEVGSESLQAGLIAGGIGLLLVILYCLFYYRLLGLITVLSLLLSGVLVYAVMVLLGRWMDLSLDMAGVAGLIIAIGITADSFVVYFERLKDEVREGRTFRSAVPRGWERAKRTILSADAVTFLSAVILYVLAVGEVKGFAFTLGLSTVLDLVVVFLVTHPLVALAAGSKVFTSPKLSGLGAVAEAGARHRVATSRLNPKEA